MAKQVDIRGSFRVLHQTPGHVTYGVWVNGGKSGDLVVRQEERVGFEIMMKYGGFVLHEPVELGPMGAPGERPMYDPLSGEAIERD